MSPLVHNMLTSEAIDFHFVVNGCEYNQNYLLTNGIYPQWSYFVQTIHEATNEKRKHFSSRQEAMQKDVEHCFGILHARFAIIRNPNKQWSLAFISDIMFTCCILYNMILEDEAGVEGLEDILRDLQDDAPPLQRGPTFDDLTQGQIELENFDTHYELR